MHGSLLDHHPRTPPPPFHCLKFGIKTNPEHLPQTLPPSLACGLLLTGRGLDAYCTTCWRSAATKLFYILATKQPFVVGHIHEIEALNYFLT